MSGVPTALALGSYVARVLSDSCLPAWTAWIAAAAALAHIVLIAIPAMLFAWITVTSIVLLRAETIGDNVLRS
jgi:hypothetical protein